MASDPVHIVSRGAWGAVEWAIDSKGEMPAREFYLDLTAPDKAKVNTLFGRLAEFGKIRGHEKFKQLGAKAGPQAKGLWEFKSFQIRFIGDFRRGKRFITAYGTRKKKDDLRRAEIDKALRILTEHDAREGGVK